MTRAERMRANSARYAARHPERMKAAHKIYRAKNRERLLAYQAQYRLKHGSKPREKKIITPKPKPILVPRDNVTPQPQKIISMYVSCSFCDARFRRGTPEYYDGSFDKGEFCCGDCSENLELEA